MEHDAKSAFYLGEKAYQLICPSNKITKFKGIPHRIQIPDFDTINSNTNASYNRFEVNKVYGIVLKYL